MMFRKIIDFPATFYLLLQSQQCLKHSFNMKTIKVLSFISLISLLLSGCTGPQGPTGPTGTTGANGINGAGIVSIGLFGISNLSWIQIGSPNKATGFQANLPDADITDTLFEVVQVYVSIGSTHGPWIALPCSDIYYSAPNDTIDQLKFFWKLDTVNINYNMLSPGYSVLPKSIIWASVAVIPATVMKRHPGTNWKDGNAVMHIPEVEAAMSAIKN
jgi:hypothetical protein